MEARDYVIQVLTRAEDRIAARLKEAAEDRQYAVATELASISQRVRDLIESVAIAERGDDQEETAPTGRTGPGARRISKGRAPADPPSSGSEGRTSSRYPRFVLSEGRLVKVAWSKTEGTEYRHRAPEASVRAVVAALRALESGEFAMKQLSVEDGNGAKVPAYQTNVIVAWLGTVGAVRKAGRGGYLAFPDRLTTADMERYWTALDADPGPPVG